MYVRWKGVPHRKGYIKLRHVCGRKGSGRKGAWHGSTCTRIICGGKGSGRKGAGLGFDIWRRKGVYRKGRAPLGLNMRAEHTLTAAMAERGESGPWAMGMQGKLLEAEKFSPAARSTQDTATTTFKKVN